MPPPVMYEPVFAGSAHPLAESRVRGGLMVGKASMVSQKLTEVNRDIVWREVLRAENAAQQTYLSRMFPLDQQQMELERPASSRPATALGISARHGPVRLHHCVHGCGFIMYACRSLHLQALET